jgi:hypothetical protein
MQGMDDCHTSQIKQAFAHAVVAGAVALPVSDVGQTVLHLDTFSQLGTSFRRQLSLPQLLQQPLIGWILTLRRFRLVVQRSRNAQLAQVVFGNCTCAPGVNGSTISTIYATLTQHSPLRPVWTYSP